MYLADPVFLYGFHHQADAVLGSHFVSDLRETVKKFNDDSANRIEIFRFQKKTLLFQIHIIIQVIKT